MNPNCEGAGSEGGVGASRGTGGTAGRSAVSTSRILREGTMAGISGYASVVLAVTVLDLLSGRSAFHTAAQLGGWLFHPMADAISGPGWSSAMAYNGFHLVLSLGVGLVAATMVAVSERITGFWFVALTLLVIFGSYSVGVLGTMAVEFKAITDWPTAVLGTAAWLFGMTVYLRFAHPRLVHRIERASTERGG